MSFFRGLAGFLSWGLCLVLAGISAIVALILYLLDRGQSFIEINSLHIGIAVAAALPQPTDSATSVRSERAHGHTGHSHLGNGHVCEEAQLVTHIQCA